MPKMLSWNISAGECFRSTKIIITGADICNGCLFPFLFQEVINTKVINISSRTRARIIIIPITFITFIRLGGAKMAQPCGLADFKSERFGVKSEKFGV